MCAINGYTGEDRGLVERMNAVTLHRGPDGTRIFMAPGVTLGQNRLAIIDLDPRAYQPIVSTDGRYVIVCNGEIYNYRELKNELTAYQFKTEGDTEVILAGFIAWGVTVFEKLNGMFTCAIYDTQTKELVVARDPMGIKPLYYTTQNGKFIFSSELKGVLASMHNPQVNTDAMNVFFDVLYVPGPRTLVVGIHKLEPGTYAVVREGKVALSKYVSQVHEENGTSVVSTLSSAVARQLVSDRPVGVFLSGGLDSSIVLHHVMEHAGRAETFTVGFSLPESSQGEDAKFNSDQYLAQKTAQHYGTNHHEYVISFEEVRSALPAIFESMDEPVGNPTIIPTYFLSKRAREHVVVALDGSGGDELFGGYEWYKINRLREWYQYLPVSLREIVGSTHPVLKKLAIRDTAEWYHAFMGQMQAVKSPVLQAPYSRPNIFLEQVHALLGTCDGNLTKQIMDVDRKMWLVDESLMRSDKMSMAHGLELRVPLLDLAVVAYAEKISSHKKVSFFETKRVLRDAYRHILPEHLFHEPKRGWFSPGAKWLRDPVVAAYMHEVLSPTYNEKTKEVFVWSLVEEMLEKHKQKKGYYNRPLWGLMLFQVWARNHNITFK